ncbi:hypothetical protein VTO73DRAFT_9550 [Trametes versicolor]
MQQPWLLWVQRPTYAFRPCINHRCHSPSIPSLPPSLHRVPHSDPSPDLAFSRISPRSWHFHTVASRPSSLLRSFSRPPVPNLAPFLPIGPSSFALVFPLFSPVPLTLSLGPISNSLLARTRHLCIPPLFPPSQPVHTPGRQPRLFRLIVRFCTAALPASSPLASTRLRRTASPSSFASRNRARTPLHSMSLFA